MGTTVFAAADTTGILYQTATMGTPRQTGGTVISASQYLGTRFQITERRIATAVGGHFGSSVAIGEQTTFAALVRLTSMSDFPDSLNPLNTPDVLGTTVFALPKLSNDVIAPIGPVELTPGIYGVVFGSGQFGASGPGFAAGTNVPVGIDSNFFYLSLAGQHWNNVGTGSQDRFVVYGEIPEPSGAILLIVPVLFSARRRRRPVGAGAGRRISGCVDCQAL